MSRIKYYSSSDLSSGHNLNKCEEILKKFDEKNEYNDINDILELYNISLFFDHDIKLLKWSESEYQKYKIISKQMKSKCYIYFDSINKYNLKTLYGTASFEYRNNFWTLLGEKIDMLNIDDNCFSDFINNEHINIYDLLSNKRIVKKYSNVIKDYLIENFNIGADVLVHLYIIKNNKDEKINIPECMSNEDKVKIITDYISSKQANLSYLELLLNVSDSDIPLDVRIRKKIKKRIEEMKEELFKNGIKINSSYSVSIIPNLDETVKYNFTNNSIEISYDINWIQDNLDNPTLLNNFIYLFEYVDRQYRWNCVTKKRNLGLFEKIFTTRAFNDYLVTTSFQSTNYLFNMQQSVYYSQLLKFNIRIERIIEWFFNEYLYNEFGIQNFNVRMSSNDSTYLEKCRNDLAELESVLKKYNFYVEDGFIDQELVTMSHNPVSFDNIKSILKNKYVYVYNKTEFENICYALFSDQCMLKYVERIKETYDSFYELLLNQEILKSDIHHYEEESLNLLLDNNLIYIENEIIKIKDHITIIILKDIYENEVLSYWRLSEHKRDKVDLLIDKRLLKTTSSLLSIPESEYLNYMLNNKYSNSLFLRNMYLHGTQQFGENSLHESNYMVILRLFILIIIKINDELCMKEYLDEINK